MKEHELINLLPVLEANWDQAKKDEKETDAHPCDYYDYGRCICKGACSCHWAKVPPDHARAVNLVRQASHQFYWLCFNLGIGGRAHSFLEFNGLMKVYADVMENAVRAGFDPQELNAHVGTPFPIMDHEVEYLAEKLNCIFGPLLTNGSTARAILLKELFQIVEDRDAERAKEVPVLEPGE